MELDHPGDDTCPIDRIRTQTNYAHPEDASCPIDRVCLQKMHISCPINRMYTRRAEDVRCPTENSLPINSHPEDYNCP